MLSATFRWLRKEDVLGTTSLSKAANAECEETSLVFTFKEDLPSTVPAIGKALRRFTKQVHSRGFAPEIRWRVETATHEALLNAHNHGNHADPRKRISFQAAFGRGTIVVRVTDQGEGFDPDRVRNSLGDESALLKPSGRGLIMIRSLASTVQFE
ncbi:MAG: ATP-binding protein, partial [Nitrospirae bacterium]|nr:ATP-binding protein [Nitrospirota bacterium]